MAASWQQAQSVRATSDGERAVERHDATAVSASETEEVSIRDLLPCGSGANLRQDCW